jgi:DNA-binding response OmpR family regulator
MGAWTLRTHKILVADDSPIEAERIRDSLQALGSAEITLVDDGAAAIRASKSTRFDLVLCDYEMPSLNGLQVVRLLRSTWSRLELPILMLTVRDDVQTKVLSLRQGANDYVTKPVEPEELLARVQAQLDLKSAVEENIRARMQMLETRKLETIGRLAASIAHELNTPAQFSADNVVFLQKVFAGSSELLESTRDAIAKLPPGQAWADDFLAFWKQRHLDYLLLEAPKALDEALKGVMRMARTARDLKEFAGVTDKSWGLSDLNRALENTVAVSQSLWSSVAQVSFHLDPALPQLACDIVALKQAFFNILITAVEEAQKAGKAPRATLQIEIHSAKVANGLEVRIVARGPGVSKELPALLTRLRTSSEVSGSAANGLGIAHSIILHQHKGLFRCESGPDQSTTFIVELPEGQASPGGTVHYAH